MATINPKSSVAPKAPANKAPAATGAPTSPPPSAAPGTPDAAAKKEKKAKVKRIAHPALFDVKTNQAVLLTSVPADYDPKIHKPLRVKDFKEEALYLELRAERLEKQAKKFREMAAESRATGNSADKVKAKKLLNVAKKYDSLIAELKATGMDVDGLLAKMKAAAEAAPAAS